jgi:NhaP-type Na+/H+ or K+/H+ antiporter
MSWLTWMTFGGGLLLVLALSSAYLRRLPVSTALIYLGVGVAIGPIGMGWVAIDLRQSASWMEHLTEVAVILSLFVGGLRLRLPLRHPAWRAPLRLAGPVMLASIAGMALLAHYAIGLEPAMALLLGAVLAPTDPVLASAVAVNRAADHDRMRYGLSGEAGLNDGAAFPFVIFALLWAENGEIGSWVGEWALQRLVWAVPAGLVLGYVLARGVGRLAIWLRSRHQDTAAPSDFLALALVALSYTGAEFIGAWGFLAVFAAGVGLRRAEVRVVRENPHPAADVDEGGADGADVPDRADGDVGGSKDAREAVVAHPPAEDLVAAQVSAEELSEPAVAAGTMVSEVLSFGDTVERLLEVLLVVLVGVALGMHWNWAAVPLAVALFVAIRPLSALLLLVGTPTTQAQRGLMGWFGIRGIGSLYYVSYALNHGAGSEMTSEMVGLTVSVIALSVVVHGMTARPILAWYERTLERGDDAASKAERATGSELGARQAATRS